MASPREVVIGNLETGENFTLQFVPSKVKLSQEAAYNRVLAPGASFQDMQYAGTNNLVTEFQVVADALASGAPDVLDVQNFLFSLLHPPQEVDSVKTGAPPRVLISWPGWMAQTTAMPKIDIEVTRFAFDGEPRPTYFIASIKLEEKRTKRLGFQRVRQLGLRRSA